MLVDYAGRASRSPEASRVREAAKGGEERRQRPLRVDDHIKQNACLPEVTIESSHTPIPRPIIEIGNEIRETLDKVFPTTRFAKTAMVCDTDETKADKSPPFTPPSEVSPGGHPVAESLRFEPGNMSGPGEPPNLGRPTPQCNAQASKGLARLPTRPPDPWDPQLARTPSDPEDRSSHGTVGDIQQLELLSRGREGPSSPQHRA